MVYFCNSRMIVKFTFIAMDNCCKLLDVYTHTFYPEGKQIEYFIEQCWTWSKLHSIDSNLNISIL